MRRKGKKGLIAIGKVVSAHGLKGSLKVLPLTDFPERFRERRRFVFYNEFDDVVFEGDLEEVSSGGRFIFLKVRGCDTRDRALKLVGTFIKVKEEELPPLKEGEFYFHEIIGLDVYTDEGEYLGKVVDIIRTGANDVFQVKGDREYMIPALKSVVKEMNLKKGIMVITPMKGLLE